MISKGVYAVLTVMVIASFVGFCIENVWISCRFGYTDNRGMILPFLLGYGIACIIIYDCFGLPEHPKILGFSLPDSSYSQLLYSGCVFLAILVGESSLGYAVEHFTGIRWWDYSALPLHIGRYTSIPTSLGFTLAVYLFMDYIFPYFYKIGENLYASGQTHGILAAAALLVFDNIHAFLYMNKHHETFKLWKHENRFGRERTRQA